MNVTAIIPARMASTRFPNKPLFNFMGLPMIEHVRRRVELCNHVDRVIVATCDEQIYEVVTEAGGEVVMTSDRHPTGSDRIAEVARGIETDIVINVQGDEPLLLPDEIDHAVQFIRQSTIGEAWNATVEIKDQSELESSAVVKALVGANNRILSMSRRPFSIKPFIESREVFRKVLGFIAYRKATLLKVTSLPLSPIEKLESIEQMRLIENGFALENLRFESNYPGVNLPEEADQVAHVFKTDKLQQRLLELTLR